MHFVENRDIELADFEAWGGAVPRLKELVKHPRAYEWVSCLLDEIGECKEEPMEDVNINDYIWFQMEDDLAEEGMFDPDKGEYTEAAD